MNGTKPVLFTTALGGTVGNVNGKYVFITPPNCPCIKPGTIVPEEWGIFQIN